MTSMPSLKLPAQRRPRSSKARAVITLLFTAPDNWFGVSPKREIRGDPESLSSCQPRRHKPSPLVNQSVSPIGWLFIAKAASWQEERLSGRFHVTGEISTASGSEGDLINEPADPVTLATARGTDSRLNRRISTLSLQSRTPPSYLIALESSGKVAIV